VFGRFLPHRKGFVEGRRQQTIFSERKEAGDQEQAQGCIAVSSQQRKHCDKDTKRQKPVLLVLSYFPEKTKIK